MIHILIYINIILIRSTFCSSTQNNVEKEYRSTKMIISDNNELNTNKEHKKEDGMSALAKEYEVIKKEDERKPIVAEKLKVQYKIDEARAHIDVVYEKFKELDNQPEISYDQKVLLYKEMDTTFKRILELKASMKNILKDLEDFDEETFNRERQWEDIDHLKKCIKDARPVAMPKKTSWSFFDCFGYN